MLDKYKRTINYMRISLTDRCNLRCAYCRPENAKMVEHAQILRYEEILRIAQCAVTLGITRFKITGGEPLVRKDAVDFITKLKQMEGVEQVTLTTNGTLLAASLPQLLACSLDGINISLDTVDKDFYSKITGGGELEAVTKSIKAAVQSGLRCKINCVPLKNNCTNSKHLLDLLQFARNLGIPLRFIELMPLSCNHSLAAYTGDELRTILHKAGYTLAPIKERLGNGPAVYYEAAKNGHTQIIGFIEPLHGKFCASCNRVRLTSTGQLKPCLYSQPTLDLRQLLRNGREEGDKQQQALPKELIIQALQKAISQKPWGHHFEEMPAPFNMNEIGG